MGFFAAARAVRWLKYYTMINGFILLVALASWLLVSRAPRWSATIQATALYAASLLRIFAVVQWFEWIAMMKASIRGNKRRQLTRTQRVSIYRRIVLLVVPTECLSFWILQFRIVEQPALSSMGVASFVEAFAYFIPKSFAFEVFFDLFHYVAHWTCHRITWLYQHVHKRHHWHLHPCPLSTYEQDAVDLLLTNVMPVVMASYLSPTFTLYQLHILFAYKTYVEVAGHSGLEIKGFSFPQLPLVSKLGVCLRVHDHDLHHMHPKFNFAKRFSLWDKIFRTFQPGNVLNEMPVTSLGSC